MGIDLSAPLAPLSSGSIPMFREGKHSWYQCFQRRCPTSHDQAGRSNFSRESQGHGGTRPVQPKPKTKKEAKGGADLNVRLPARCARIFYYILIFL